MLSYQYLPEEWNRRVLRVINLMLISYVTPLWMQLLYLGEMADPSGMTRIASVSIHPVTLALLVGNLAMPIYVLLLELVQSRVQNFWIYLGAQAAGMAIMYIVLPDRNGGIPRLLVCAALLIGALYARIHETHLGYPAAGWLVVGVLMVMIGEQMGLHDLRMMGYVTEIISAVLFVLYYNVCSLEQALGHTRGAGGVPYDKVQQTNIVIMLLWILLSFGVILAMTLSGVGDVLFDAVGRGSVWLMRQLVRFLGWLVSLLPRSDAYEQTASAVDQFQQGTMNGSNSILVIILTAIWETIMVLYRLAGVAAIVYGIAYLCKWVYRSFREATLDERVQRNWQLSHERDHVTGNMIKTRLSAMDPTPAARIRRTYIRFLKRGEGYRQLRASMTPEEQMTASVNPEGILSMEQEAALREIRLLYEKARYLPSKCTLHDVRAIRQAIQSMGIRL